MKSIIVTVAFLITCVMGAQNGIEPTYTANNDVVTAVYYHENGKISQEGSYKDGKLHGFWTAYDTNGYKISSGEYENGNKVGKWLFWKEDGIVEVTYTNNKVASVNVKSFKGVADSE
jgi:antitoxin component YwqK of YwqJK toxin-antitoxin module